MVPIPAGDEDGPGRCSFLFRAGRGTSTAIGRARVRTYELALVADPRISDDDLTALSTEYKQLITSRGGEVLREESWGRRKLAYPIRKLTEGRYLFLFLQIEPAKAGLLKEVELRLNQNDKILRYLTVRTDEGLKRAAGRAKPGDAPPRTGGYYDVDPAVAAAAAEAAAVADVAGAQAEATVAPAVAEIAADAVPAVATPADVATPAEVAAPAEVVPATDPARTETEEA